MLISLLNPTAADETPFLAASDALQELMLKSAFSDGSGTKSLTEPLLLWLDTLGTQVVNATLSTGEVTEISHSLCKLLVAIGDHSTSYIAANIASQAPVAPSPTSAPATPVVTTPMFGSPNGAVKTKGHLVQSFLRLVLAYTGLAGFYGVDEEESEMTLGFWYLLQEALWSTDFYFEEGGDENGEARVECSVFP